MVNLGALGVVTKVTLDVQPTFQVSQVVYENLSMDQLEHHLDEIFASGYSVSLFTDWQNHRISQVWVKRRVEPGSTPIRSGITWGQAGDQETPSAAWAFGGKLHRATGHSRPVV